MNLGITLDDWQTIEFLLLQLLPTEGARTHGLAGAITGWLGAGRELEGELAPGP